MIKLEKKYIFFLLPFISFIIGYLFANLVIGNKTIITPNLIGLSIYEALKTTSPNQVNIRILTEKKSKDIPEGTIISQKPTPGRQIKAHQPIFVTTIAAPPQTIAPHLLGQNHTSIERQCQELGIKQKSYYVEYHAPSETCIGQIPQAQDPLPDKKITLYFAQHKTNMFIMPDLTDKALSEVMEFLQSNPDTKTTIYHGSVKINKPDESMRVKAQNPLAGSLVSLQPPLNVQLKVTW